MTENGVRYIVGTGTISLDDVPRAGMLRRGKPIKVKKEPSNGHAAPAGIARSVFGLKVQRMQNLGMAKKPDKKTFWPTVLNALAVGEGFEIPMKDFNRARQAILKANKNCMKLFGKKKQFIFEDVNSKGEVQAGVGRVGRIK